MDMGSNLKLLNACALGEQTNQPMFSFWSIMTKEVGGGVSR